MTILYNGIDKTLGYNYVFFIYVFYNESKGTIKYYSTTLSYSLLGDLTKILLYLLHVKCSSVKTTYE